MCTGVQLLCREEDKHLWEWFHFSKEHYHNLEFRPVGDEGLCELILLRKGSGDSLHSVFSLFPELNEYPTSDLFRQHPDPDRWNLWRYAGRTDDMITFANAAKYSPLAYEDALMSAEPLVKAAVMVGIQRPCAGLIVELSKDVPADEALETIWPAISKINDTAPKHAHVKKEMVIIGGKDKPFARAAKQTVIKGQTLSLFEDEIEAAYKRHGQYWQLRL
jgi:hypothetical protein